LPRQGKIDGSTHSWRFGIQSLIGSPIGIS
jgi:hypothetical protein